MDPSPCLTFSVAPFLIHFPRHFKLAPAHALRLQMLQVAVRKTMRSNTKQLKRPDALRLQRRRMPHVREGQDRTASVDLNLLFQNLIPNSGESHLCVEKQKQQAKRIEVFHVQALVAVNSCSTGDFIGIGGRSSCPAVQPVDSVDLPRPCSHGLVRVSSHATSSCQLW